MHFTFIQLNLDFKNIKWIFTDVDGVLTDCGVYYSKNGEELKRFSFRDGMGIEILRKNTDIKIAVITGEDSEIVQRRTEKLKIDKVFLGIKNKSEIIENFLVQNNLTFKNIAYIGDDINDLEVMSKISITACPKDAVEEIKKISKFITINNGGYGALRDFIEIIIKNIKTT